jgi:hypothetical protein
MESQLHDVWESAVKSPFVPTIGKDSQFTLGISLLTIGILLTGLFGLSKDSDDSEGFRRFTNLPLDRTLVNVPLIGLPASLAVG